jgi:hypothetical protein
MVTIRVPFQPGKAERRRGSSLGERRRHGRSGRPSTREEVVPYPAYAHETRCNTVWAVVVRFSFFWILLYAQTPILEGIKSLYLGRIQLFAHTMCPKKLLPSDAYTVGLVYVKPLEMNAITVNTHWAA